MSFNSYGFVFLFLPVTVAGYWLLAPLKRRAVSLGWLLASSVIFYGYASFKSLLILLPSILLDYALARLFFRVGESRTGVRTAIITIGIVANVLFLGYFKYRNFFLDTVGDVLGTHFDLKPLILPLGISFLTFQKIAFLCDILAGKIVAIDLTEYLVFALFFPRAVAGPIVHYKEIVSQLGDTRTDGVGANVAVGFCLFSMGLFKKCVVADGLAGFAPLAFSPDPIGGPVTLILAWMGLLSYTLQLYFDFSGYSDMALGAARMIGIRMPMNFNSPLKASSIVEFWSRWHITLTRFLTWYIYIPLVRQLTRARAARNKPLLQGQRSTPGAIAVLLGIPTLVTMLVSGVWHGAGWQFVIWGLLHGGYLTVNQTWRMFRARFWPDQRSYQRVMQPVGFVLTFVCVAFALVFFRANSVGDALTIVKGLVGLNGVIPQEIQLLRGAGFDFDWTAMWTPWQALKWILPLLGVVTLWPNSLEILRRYQPALDFPGGVSPVSATPPDMAVQSAQKPTSPWTKNVRRGVQHGWALLKGTASSGVVLDRLTATVMGILFTLGAMAISRGGGFIYGQF